MLAVGDEDDDDAGRCSPESELSPSASLMYTGKLGNVYPSPSSVSVMMPSCSSSEEEAYCCCCC